MNGDDLPRPDFYSDSTYSDCSDRGFGSAGQGSGQFASFGGNGSSEVNKSIDTR